eukprot:CAMPEP_0114530018 /NCGR_PEP_ID=MMETSP0109-20121206/25184_1 /TAXON_ID=29199 /ORGANISM="Chlorarachnion reptans, Strain CCCM449" /LENGTH=1002 /DNA_ID=CAMNT_0001712539 /DNA_START=40 /DNA_END=3047 /DNA_ORIENTATION=-
MTIGNDLLQLQTPDEMGEGGHSAHNMLCDFPPAAGPKSDRPPSELKDFLLPSSAAAAQEPANDIPTSQVILQAHPCFSDAEPQSRFWTILNRTTNDTATRTQSYPRLSCITKMRSRQRGPCGSRYRVRSHFSQDPAAFGANPADLGTKTDPNRNFGLDISISHSDLSTPQSIAVRGLRGGYAWGTTREEDERDLDEDEPRNRNDNLPDYLDFLKRDIELFESLGSNTTSSKKNRETIIYPYDPNPGSLRVGNTNQNAMDFLEPVELNPLRGYALMYSLALLEEFKLQQREIEEKIRLSTVQDLVNDGVCLLNLKVKMVHGPIGEVLYRFSKADGSLFVKGEHQFKSGDNIIISSMKYGDPLNPRRAHDGYIKSRGSRAITAQFFGKKDKLPMPEILLWRMDMAANPTAFERMQDGIEALCMNFNHPWLENFKRKCPIQVVLARRLREMPTSEDVIRNTPPSSHPPRYLLEGPYLPCYMPDYEPKYIVDPCEYISEDRIRAELSGVMVNDIQREAIVNSIYNPISMIQGPPGTGKTTTASELISAWLRLHPRLGYFPNDLRRILVVAQSNIAVDQLCEALLKRGVNALRVGSTGKIRAGLFNSSLEGQLRLSPRMQEITRKHQLLAMYSKEVMNLDPETEEYRYHAKNISRMYDKLDKESGDIINNIVSKHEVICATCISSGSAHLDRLYYGMVVVDEAAQATEPEVLAACRRAMHRIVMFGDQHQLPPTVLATNPNTECLKVSLFDDAHDLGWYQRSDDTVLRLVPARMLRIQYRMHPIVSQWPNKRFYNGLLMDGITAEERKIGSKGWWPFREINNIRNEAGITESPKTPSTFPVCFLTLPEGYDEAGGDNSRMNVLEAQVVTACVKRLLGVGPRNANSSNMTAEGKQNYQALTNSTLKSSDIGVISPYAAQVELLRKLFSEDPEIASFQSSTNGTIEIKTVDGYQGREKEFIVMSTVVANDDGRVGFLSDWRRTNVALTRAKKGLIVVGNDDTLSYDPHW